MDKRKRNSDHAMKKKIICKYSLFKECFKTIINRLENNFSKL